MCHGRHEEAKDTVEEIRILRYRLLVWVSRSDFDFGDLCGFNIRAGSTYNDSRYDRRVVQGRNLDSQRCQGGYIDLRKRAIW